MPVQGGGTRGIEAEVTRKTVESCTSVRAGSIGRLGRITTCANEKRRPTRFTADGGCRDNEPLRRVDERQRTAAIDDLQPEADRGQSSNVTAAPFCENVTPRAMRADGVPSGCSRLTCPTASPVMPSKIRN